MVKLGILAGIFHRLVVARVRRGFTARKVVAALLVVLGTLARPSPHAIAAPGANMWRSLPSAGAPSPRWFQATVWTGTEMIVWGGSTAAGFFGGGAAYNPVTDTWRQLPSAGAPSPRYGASAVWTGAEMLVWGGTGPTGPLNDGSAYNPTTNTWISLPDASALNGRCFQSAVWTGTSLLIWGGNAICDGFGARLLGDGAALTLGTPHDARYFAQTGYRIDNAVIWDYFQRRGGVPTFGYPTSRTFLFQGFTVQFFQRRVVQVSHRGQARLLNLLDPGLLPYPSLNGSTFPRVDSGLVATAPPPTDQPAVLAWVQQHAPDSVGGNATNFFHTFRTTVSAQTALPSGGDARLLPGFDLEVWGVPTSAPLVDPHNHQFISLRWQRGIMLYDAACTCTQGVLLADYLKDILTGAHLPADLAQEAATSPLLRQYAPGLPGWVRDPRALPHTDLTDAFTPE